MLATRCLIPISMYEYYRNNVQQRLADGCILVFATQRAAWSALIFAFPYSYFKDPVRLYDLDPDQLRTNDGVIHGWEPKAEDWIGLKDKLYVMPYLKPQGIVWEIYAIRLLTGARQTCQRAYYLGRVDLNRRDQLLGDWAGG